MNGHLCERISVIGLGLMGGSLARAIHDRGLCRHISASDTNEVSLAYAMKHGFVHSTSVDPSAAAMGSDIVLLAAPIAALSDIMSAIAPVLKADALIMDVGSVKLAAIEAIVPLLPAHAHYIPAHPIAGSEQSGVGASRAGMFERKRVVLCPEVPEITPELELATRFWHMLGAQVEPMPAHLHDQIYAYVSHLPQLLAFAAAQPLEEYSQQEQSDDTLKSFLRLSHSSTELWIDIFLQNRENILKGLDRYVDALSHIIRELESAPAEEQHEATPQQVYTRLFPRIAASCLITTVMEAERKAGFSFARYAGTGFADFTCPATREPDEEIEMISRQHALIREVLQKFMRRLKQFREAIDTGSGQNASAALG